jgi:TP901 family phage tail tape measure protein
MAANESIIRIRGDASQAVSEFQKLRNATIHTYQAIEKSAETFKELRENQRAMIQVSKIASKAIKELDRAVVKSGPGFGKATEQVKSYQMGLERLKKSFSGLSLRAHAFSRDLKSVGLAIRNSGKNLQFMGRSIMIGMLPFANAIRKASNFAKALEQAEIRFIKITQVDTGKFDELADKFERLSNAFGVSRDLITDIATDFALVGMPVSQVETLARASNELAILGSIDVGPAKDILTSTVFAMRNMATLRGETLSFNDAIKQATGQMYLFNIVNNNTAMAIKDMATAIPKLVPITVQFGLTVTEAAGALAAMKASGVSAAEGTVALRTGLLRLTSLTKQADEKVEGARQRLKDFNFEAGVGIETLANFGHSLLAIRRELGDAAAFDIVKNILGIRQTAKVQLFVMDMQSAENQIDVVAKAMQRLGGADVFGSKQIRNMTEFARASREPSEAMMQAANDLLKDSEQMEDVTSQFLRSLIIQMSGVENAQKDSMKELQTVLESDAFKMQQAKTAMKNALTDIGGLINMLIVDHILPLVQHWVNAFKSMPDGVKKVIVILASVVAAFGPILYMLAIMKMAFGQTMQIMAGAIGKFFTGFTAAGRAATIAANEEAVALAVLSRAQELSAVTASKNAIAQGHLGAAMSASTAVSIDSAAQNAIHAASHRLDAAAAQASAVSHHTNALSKLLRNPLGAGGAAMINSIKTSRIGRGARVAGATVRHPLQFGRGVRGGKAALATGAPGWNPLGQTRAGMAGIRTRGRIMKATSPYGQFMGGRTARLHAWGAQGMRKATTVSGAMGAGQFKHGAVLGVKKGMGGIAKAAKKTVGGLGGMLKLFGRMLRPIKMIKTIFMSFNPWVLGFMLLLGAVAAIWVTIKNNFETFKAAAQPGLDALKEAWLAIKAALGEVMRAIFQVFNRLSFGGKKGADEGTQMGNVFKAVFQGIAFALKGVAKLFSFLATVISTAMDFATPYINYLLGLLTGVIEVVKAIVAVVRGDFSGAWKHAKRAIGAILLGLVSMVDGVMNFIINQIVRLMNVAAGILSQIGKLPGMGWAKELAADIEGAGAAMQDFGATALDGVRDTISQGTGITPDELIQVGDEDVRDVGAELGKVLGEGVAEGFEDEMEYATPGMHEAINDAAKEGAEAAKAFADVWSSAFKKFVTEVNKQIRKGMARAVKHVKDSFNEQTNSVVAAYDAQIDAINEVIKEEQRLSKEIAYQTKRREQIRDMALRRDAYRRNRALAIYEGRIDDARSLDLKERKDKEDSDQKLTDLDTKHGETLLAQQRQDTIAQINEQKRAYKDLRSDMAEELDGVLTELTKFTPKNQAEWQKIVDDIDAEVTRIVGGEESAGIMGRFAGSYHPDMGELGITGFDWDGMIGTAKDTAIENMREIYQWDPGTMEGDGPFGWLFDEFARVETEFTDFETMIKGWRERLEQALLGDQTSTQEAIMMATKGLTRIPSGRTGAGGYESDPVMAANANTPAEAAWMTIMRTINNVGSGGWTGTEMEREQGWNPNSAMYNPFNYQGRVSRNVDFNYAGYDAWGSQQFYGGVVKAQYGRYLSGFGSSMIPVMAHGGEFVMSAKATRNIGVGALNNMNNFSKLSGPNGAGGGVTNNSSSNITIQVDTFVGQREWFEKMMSDYNIHIAPSSERARGIEKRTVGSYTERNTRSRV